ncbi:hypothetical protein OG225_07080 [Nocardia sp. NBC_01377]|uniref:hypothetical protein n=1 Tax=Nocardia sp. NBC_01377 TaxID=2903595 RepID=UPI0032432FD4
MPVFRSIGVSPSAVAEPYDVIRPMIGSHPRWWRRCSAGWAGRRDGRRGVDPDPDTGVTPYLHMLWAACATMVESERLRTAAACAPLDAERARLVQIRERALCALTDEDPDSARRSPVDRVAEVRAARARAALGARWQHSVDSATEQIAVLDERRADRVVVGELRIRCCVENIEQLVAYYWRALQRAHPELPQLRAGYGVPPVVVAPHPMPR